MVDCYKTINRIKVTKRLKPISNIVSLKITKKIRCQHGVVEGDTGWVLFFRHYALQLLNHASAR